ncbi:general transcription factor IIH subunit 3-like isoform X2 [Lineus longissimus]
MFSHKNSLAIIAAHTNRSYFLFPKQESPPKTTISQVENGDDTSTQAPSKGKYELFCRMNDTVAEELHNMVLDSSQREVYTDSLVAGALSMALCYIHRKEKEHGLRSGHSSRILVVRGSEDNPSQYMNLMNVVFTAQKQDVLIDACILDNESGLLQQACDITGGIYLKIPQVSGLLQYLLWAYLPDADTRKMLALPPRVQVDYRAACFCHRNLIDIGYVCSVCLSIFCTFSPICSTCQTTFKILGPPKFMKKKTKKPNS